MDRREALKKLAVGGVTAAGVTAVMTSTAFGDGGTANCRPTNVSTANPALTTNVTGLNKDAVRVISSLASLAAATCNVCHAGTTPVSSVQYRWTVDASPSGTTVGIYDAATLGNRIDTAFQATLFATAYLRNVAGGNLTAGSYSIRLTARWICTNGTRKAWVCRHWILPIAFSTSPGSDGSVTAGVQVNGTGSSTACDSPAP